MTELTPHQRAVLRAAVSPWPLHPQYVARRVGLDTPVGHTLAHLEALEVLGLVDGHSPTKECNAYPQWYRTSPEGLRLLGAIRGVSTERSDHGQNLIVTLTRTDLQNLVDDEDASSGWPAPVVLRGDAASGYDYVEVRVGIE